MVVDLMWMTHFKKEDLPCVLLIATHSSFISGLEWKRQRKKELLGQITGNSHRSGQNHNRLQYNTMFIWGWPKVLHSVQKDHSNIISHINSKQHSSAVKMGTVLNKEIQGI